MKAREYAIRFHRAKAYCHGIDDYCEYLSRFTEGEFKDGSWKKPCRLSFLLFPNDALKFKDEKSARAMLDRIADDSESEIWDVFGKADVVRLLAKNKCRAVYAREVA